ncbi:tRNA (5-methylaminomethyl-2-thiouridine)(34)-methyltransferase MnmD [Myroides pelagicus]|uniref:tRNA (5-methylaminomethyl-2-thiouridine)(34)-methyltransferase MnmD n=1 Tax=Myroides pelagicus TaxID=270914 RepID=A0A7K1GP03_9FLAO|nr:tRNA (5-methylaminomethyl-2-thiouridine)(34)-methyltransferase MnmD [Myroides pelagicus]MEC4113601.1 tRNA (5-methylaminomethyl-2-thiouridine)(34)-methyltransferase MnmD [Myroides pelagicus]MTH30625.1 tRNA (5-methylaminomethyl-2-thiouridine)(34)-methyltransferase MnmD [Myroides pelagicus]
MKRKVIKTEDGSSSIQIEEWGETYHSVYGAVQEAKHVYIQNGLDLVNHLNSIVVLEMGFGTGLNAYLTYLAAMDKQLAITYHAIEAYPVSEEELKALNYSEINGEDAAFLRLHHSPWNELVKLNECFSLYKMLNTFEEQVVEKESYDLIYFDVFGYPFQPDLWSEEIFKKMYDALKVGGILTTYACRGVINRTMKTVGFEVKKVAGPPGKREMVIAYKR